MVGDQPLHAAVSGSAGFGVAKLIGMQFIQEVFATGQAIRYFGIDADAVIELGGEDAKILFLTGGVEAVSYTHLDVYKRQLDTCASGWNSKALTPLPSPCWTTTGTSAPKT